MSRSRHGADDRWRAQVERRLHALETTPSGIPVCVTDPPPSSPVKLWMTVDGRLRGRRSDTGAVVELQRMTTPGPAPALSWPTGTDVFPLTFSADLEATWTASYEVNGGPAPEGRYGYGRATLIGWPRGALEQALTAAVSIVSVEVWLYNVGDITDLDPLPVKVGTHTFNPGPPGAYMPGELPADREILLPAAGPGWVMLDPADWDVEQSGVAGIVVDQGADEHLSGRVYPAGGGSAPRLRITFRANSNVGGNLL